MATLQVEADANATTPSLKRAQMGTLLTLTFIHELAHSWLRIVLNDAVPLAWMTPAVDKDDLKGESGYEVEHLIMRGTILVLWGEELHKLAAAERFNRMQGFYISKDVRRTC
jgi:hypothetical protein